MAVRGINKPSVVFINRIYPPGRGATGRVLRDLARAFVRDGWDVTVVTTGARRSHERDGAIRVLRVRARGSLRNVFSYAWVGAKLFLKAAMQRKPDLVITMTDPPMLVVAGRALARLKSCPHMHWCQDLYPDLLPMQGVRMPARLTSYMYERGRAAMKSCDKIVVVGRCMARTLMNDGIEARRIAVIPNWTDMELMGGSRRLRRRASRQPAKAASPARRLFSSGGSKGPAMWDQGPAPAPKSFEALFRDQTPKFRILYSGHAGRTYPMEDILEAASLLKTDHPEIEFVFVGDGPSFDRLAQERSRRELDNIRFLPWQPGSRLRGLMESGDLHLLTMHKDAAGLLVPSKIYSALAVGRPCLFVGPEECEAARIVKDFGAGTIITEGGGAALAGAIKSYRLSSDVWFAAHEGALQASKIFVPEESLNAWLERARDIAQIPERPVRAQAA